MEKADLSITRARIDKMREMIDSRNLDAVLIEKRENYLYLTGFSGTAAHLLITAKEAILVTDFRYIEQASKQARDYEILRLTGTFSGVLPGLLKEKNIKRIGFEGDYMTYDKLARYKDGAGDVEFVSIGDLLPDFRIIKDRFEIDTISKAVEIADLAFENTIKFIRPGITELEVAAELEYHMKKNGATGPSFETIVASGVRAAMPHGVASLKKLEPGDVITMDYGAIYNGYCSDITRTVFLGQPKDELVKIYNIVLKAQAAAEEGAVKGKTGKQIDSIAREIIAQEGYGDSFGHGLGHGVGLEIHEEPRFSPSGNKIMENGMVVTVEPGIYVTGLGGVRIEDIIVINDDKPEILTKARKDLIII